MTPETLSSTPRESLLAELCGVANATAAGLAEATAGLLASGGWNQSGIRSPEHYLTWKCGISRSDAHRIVVVARRVGAYPACAAAFAAGELSWVDSLLEMARRALSQDGGGKPAEDQHRVLWHHSIDPTGRPVLRGHQGAQVPEWMRRFLLCDATVTPVAELAPRPAGDPAGDGVDIGCLAELVGGTPVSVGRAQRIAPDRLRRLVEHRDGACRVPGCDAKQWLPMHHIVWWENGGRTDSSNLVAICGAHHRMIHREELHVTGNADDPDGLTFTDNTGRTIRAAARTAPPTGPPERAAQQLGLQPGRWHHPLGERLRYDDVWFNGAPPQHGPPELN